MPGTVFRFSSRLTLGSGSCIFWFKRGVPMKQSDKNFRESNSNLLESLTEKEILLIRKQIRLNSHAIDRSVRVIDLLVNREQCPLDARPLLEWRDRLEIAMSENDTFRKVLWRYLNSVETGGPSEGLNAVSFLLSQIKSRRSALLAQGAMK